MISTVIAFFIVLCLSPIYAGENEHGHHKKISNKEISIQMDMTGPLDLAMSRDGSGTAWQPDTSPISMMMIDISEWQLMFHGSIFAGGDFQGSSRGGIAPFSSNWIMGSIGHNLGSGRILAKTMLSLEPFTIAEGGYPLLLQTGETWKGEPLHDRQHPHDLFMELALKYVVPIKDTIALLIYVAPAGEPALGPVAFPHRVSARSNPLAPLGHHWYDSTHISFGVMTAGMFTRQWMFEASWFNGREPDENRYNIDLKIPDSYAGRISFNPSGQLSLQASYGFLKTPEPSEPDINVHRITSSVSSNFKPWNGSNIASSLIFWFEYPLIRQALRICAR